MIKSKNIMIGALVLAFAAGIPVGWIFDPGAAGAVAKRIAPSWLHDKLSPSSSQREEMKEIWSKTARELQSDDIEQCSRDQHQEILSILPDEQKAQYLATIAKYRKKRLDITEERRAIFNAGIDETMTILSAKQRARFSELLNAFREQGGPVFANEYGEESSEEPN